MDKLLERNIASLAILIPPDFEQRVNGRRKAEVGVLIDGVDTITAGTVSGYAQSILQRFSDDILVSRINSMQGLLYDSTTPRLIIPQATDASRAWFNPNLNSKDFFVPWSCGSPTLDSCYNPDVRCHRPRKRNRDY